MDNSKLQMSIYSFDVINNIIIHSFKTIIEEIFKLNFNKAFYAINSIQYSYLMADDILKNTNRDNLNQITINSFNHIYESYCIAIKTLLNLKQIRGDDVVYVSDIQTYYNSYILSDVVLYAQHTLQHINIIKNIRDHIRVIIELIYPPNCDLFWYTEMNDVINKLFEYNTKIIDDHNLIVNANNKQIILLQCDNTQQQKTNINDNNNALNLKLNDQIKQDIESVSTASSYDNIDFKNNYFRKNRRNRNTHKKTLY